ncbi:MAG TPA: LOG family protein [Spirochaetota bacterium]|nr:LOG family protein [Spirochaetota bacterium]HRS77968.1 LOG family protein [Spirochaetota bacterium]HRT74737.1 LOG family protein [Spirochaetota bacterium]
MKKEKKLAPAYDDPDFMHSREARSLRILSEYLEPEKRFRDMNINHTVVFFGSARTRPDGTADEQRYYHMAADFAFALANLSRDIERETGNPFYICTGGGPGIMEAANLGATRAGTQSIGLNIDLPFEQAPNKYITPELMFKFHYFFMRKLWFLYQAKAFIIFPGGYGTMDELFETLTMVQTRKMEKINVPILLYDREFWSDIINFDRLASDGFISREDTGLFNYFSEIQEGIDFLRPKLITLMKNIDYYLKMRFPI